MIFDFYAVDRTPGDSQFSEYVEFNTFEEAFAHAKGLFGDKDVKTYWYCRTLEKERRRSKMITKKIGRRVIAVTFGNQGVTYLAHFFFGGKVRVVANVFGTRYVWDDPRECLALIRNVICG